jgi:tetratricopeptide (TPR) repeat protein
MRFASAAFVILIFSVFGQTPLRAETGVAGVLDIWLKARESADAPNSEKVSLYLKSKALVIGNDGYDGRGWPKLSNGIKDAEAVARGLAAQGFDVTLKKDLTSSELERALKTFFIFEGAEVDTRLVVWFAGHGTTIGGEAYIVPVDAPSQKEDAQFRGKAISLRRFGEYMREAKARHVLAIFDSCFSGGVFNVARSAPPPAITLATTQQVRQFISSGDAEQQVSDDGTFRKLFLDALAGKEAEADANHDGYVTGTELGLFLQQKMTNLTNNRQTPRYGKLNDLGYDRGDFVFQIGTLEAPVPSPITYSLPSSEAAQAWAVTQNTTSLAVLEEFVRQFGNTPYGPMAHARLEELRKLTPPSPEPPASTPPAPQANTPPPPAEQRSARDDCDRFVKKPTYPKSSDDEGVSQVNTTDGPRAIAACRRALEASPNDPHLMFQLGRGYQADKNYSEAMRQYRRAADLGHANATIEMGLLYYYGLGVSKDFSESVRLWRKAADLGSHWGFHNLGYMYRTGQGVPQDPKEAARLYRKAADLGNARSYNALGLMYRNGFGVPQDYREAARLFRKGADLGNPTAMNNLGLMYFNGRGVQRDLEEAERLFRKAVELGDENAKGNLNMIVSRRRS